MPKCKIKWIDKTGKETGDENEAIGEAWVPEREQEVGGEVVKFEESKRYPICEEHTKRLREPGMQIWKFEPYKSTKNG